MSSITRSIKLSARSVYAVRAGATRAYASKAKTPGEKDAMESVGDGIKKAAQAFEVGLDEPDMGGGWYGWAGAERCRATGLSARSSTRTDRWDPRLMRLEVPSRRTVRSASSESRCNVWVRVHAHPQVHRQGRGWRTGTVCRGERRGGRKGRQEAGLELRSDRDQTYTENVNDVANRLAIAVSCILAL